MFFTLCTYLPLWTRTTMATSRSWNCSSLCTPSIYTLSLSMTWRHLHAPTDSNSSSSKNQQAIFPWQSNSDVAQTRAWSQSTWRHRSAIHIVRSWDTRWCLLLLCCLPCQRAICKMTHALWTDTTLTAAAASGACPHVSFHDIFTSNSQTQPPANRSCTRPWGHVALILKNLKSFLWGRLTRSLEPLYSLLAIALAIRWFCFALFCFAILSFRLEYFPWHCVCRWQPRFRW